MFIICDLHYVSNTGGQTNWYIDPCKYNDKGKHINIHLCNTNYLTLFDIDVDIDVGVDVHRA